MFDSVTARNNLKIIGVVDLTLSTINGCVKHEVFKYEVTFKNKANPANPIVSFALGLDTLGSCKLFKEGAKNKLLSVLLPLKKTLLDLNWA